MFLLFFELFLYEEVLNASAADYSAWSRRFWLYFPIKFLLIILAIFLPIFLTKDKIPNPFTNIQSLDWTEYLIIFFIFYTVTNN